MAGGVQSWRENAPSDAQKKHQVTRFFTELSLDLERR
jgi:hypothetical protein